MDEPEKPIETDDEMATTTSEESLKLPSAGPKRKKNRRRVGRLKSEHPTLTTTGKKKARRSLSMETTSRAKPAKGN